MFKACRKSSGMRDEQPSHIDLFSGIGGFALAARACGYAQSVFCERDEFCQSILRHHWPGTPIIGDVRDFDGSRHKGARLLSGGFPCQPFSRANADRQGTEDADRYLWPEMHRIIYEARPTYVLAENVSGLLDIEGGMVLETVLTDMEAEGYDVLPFIIPASAKGALHRRDRLWICGRLRSHRKEVVKFRESEPPHRQVCDAGQVREVLARPRDTEERHSRDVANTNQVNADSGRHGASQILKQEPPSLQGSKRYRAKKDAAYPQSKGTEPNHRRVGQWAQGASVGEKPDTLKDATHPHQVRSQGEWPNCQEEGQAGLCCGGEVKDTESGLGFMAYGIPSGILGHQGWGREPEDLPRVSVDIKMRSQKLSALGNAIVPQVAEEIIRHFTM